MEAATVAKAIRLLETRTDICTVFTDLDVCGSTAGMQSVLTIRDRWPPIELLMISSRLWDAAQIPDRGVVLGKPFDRREIVAAIRWLAACATLCELASATDSVRVSYANRRPLRSTGALS